MGKPDDCPSHLDCGFGKPDDRLSHLDYGSGKPDFAVALKDTPNAFEE